MSGGCFDYRNDSLKNDIFGWGDKPTNVFEDREISELIWDIFNLIHAYDWYVSGDTCEDTYRKHISRFKRKWFSNRGERVREIIDTAVSELRNELYKTFVEGESVPDV